MHWKLALLLLISPNILLAQSLIIDVETSFFREQLIEEVVGKSTFNKVTQIYFLEDSINPRIISINNVAGPQLNIVELPNIYDNANLNKDRFEIIQGNEFTSLLKKILSNQISGCLIIAELNNSIGAFGDLHFGMGNGNGNAFYTLPFVKLEIKNNQIVSIVHYEMRLEIRNGDLQSRRIKRLKSYRKNKKRS